MSEQASRERRLRELEARGVNPYPHRFTRTHLAQEVARAAEPLAPGELTGTSCRVAGRIAAIRCFGRGVFCDLVDGSGRIQLLFSQDRMNGQFALVELLDRGDIIGIEGVLFKTKSGEPTLQVAELSVLGKCLVPLPEKWHGLRNVGAGRSERHVQFIADAGTRDRFLTRARVFSAVRRLLEGFGYIEVQTPILQRQYGGAEARPFTTFHHAWGRDMFLSISPELFLKRAVVGGFEDVFTICPNFRNEGMDASHHPEFWMLEAYSSYKDYWDMMDLAETVFRQAAAAANGSTQISFCMGGKTGRFDLGKAWRRVRLYSAIEEGTGLAVEGMGLEDLRRAAAQLHLALPKGEPTADELRLMIFEQRVQPELVEPTIVYDYPSSLCPLTKTHRADSSLAERFQLFILGTEFANAYSELTDPRYQERQFSLQDERRKAGCANAYPSDQDFVEALRCGMPPCGGLGIGMERMAMLLTGAVHIKDAIWFPEG